MLPQRYPGLPPHPDGAQPSLPLVVHMGMWNDAHYASTCMLNPVFGNLTGV